MDLIKFSIAKPVTVIVGALLTVMFGLIALGAIPIQLTPTVDAPIVTVTTSWNGASPDEIVDSITKEQEKRLKNVTNLKSMRSNTTDGQAEVTLEFYLGSDVTRALQEVSDALRQVPDYPAEVDEPTIKAAEGAAENAIAWIIIDVDPAKQHLHPDYDITSLYDAMDKEVRPFLERIDGVAEVNIYGGREREVRVLLDPEALAQRSINPLEALAALRAENRNTSAGTIAEGKRDYRIRVMGQFESPDEILDVVIAYREGKPVYLRDVGTAELGLQKLRGFVRSTGGPCLAMNVIRQSGANVMDVMAQVRARLDEVRADILPKLHPEAGPALRMRQVYDETIYIDSAIELVLDNLWVGAGLSAIGLLVFLRSFIATGLIALSIPISLIGTFLVMQLFGRTLNVISLAGLAFATGVVVDNATVVLENIDRRRKLGDPPMQAAYRGAREVWGAILASTLTSVAVYIPVITVQEEAGQLFRDLSLALAVSVIISLIVSITIIPTACARWGGHAEAAQRARGGFRTLVEGLFGLAAVGGWMTAGLASMVRWLITGWRAWVLRPGLIIAMAGLSLLGSWWMAPPMDYLPTGNRNLVFGGLLIPPGYSVDQMNRIADRIDASVRPYVEVDPSSPEAVAALPPIFRYEAPQQPFGPQPVDNFFIGAFGGGMFVGATSHDSQVVIPVGSLLTNSMNSIPAAFGGARQSSIFGRGIQGGNTIDLEISGPQLPRVIQAAEFIFMQAAGRYGFGNVRPDPANFNLRQPEFQITLNEAGRELGLSPRDLGIAVRGLVDGAFVDDFRLGADTIDMVILPTGGTLAQKESLASIPIATTTGRIVPLDTVATVVEQTAPQAIRRIEELPAVTVRVVPPEGVPLQQVMDQLRTEIVAAAESAGLIDNTMRVRLDGTAAKLDDVRAALFGRAEAGAPQSLWQRGLIVFSLIVAAAGLVAGVVGLVRASRKREGKFIYGAIGAVLLAVVLAGLLSGIAWLPQLVTARFIWALIVTYLLMCALFESFLYPLVIMFSVPPAIVGGFAGLALVHWVTMQDPTKPPQMLDVLTMLGFVMLIGTVVNNAILLVEQALNFMHPERFGLPGEKPMDAHAAIAESVRTRMRPIFITVMTTVTGGLPLVIAPGSGSEMYRGLGAVVLGGLIVSTVFTLVLVPLVFSLAVDLVEGLKALASRGGPPRDLGGLTRADNGLLDHSAITTKPARARSLEPQAV